jgi:hypothetical protein
VQRTLFLITDPDPAAGRSGRALSASAMPNRDLCAATGTRRSVKRWTRHCETLDKAFALI